MKFLLIVTVLGMPGLEPIKIPDLPTKSACMSMGQSMKKKFLDNPEIAARNEKFEVQIECRPTGRGVV